MWFGHTNFTLWDSSQQRLANCEALRRIDWCFRLYFVLSCFIHFVWLQLLIKHNTCVSEMSSKHLPHYGLCYVRSNEWEPVFLIQKRKTARIKDVNKSQGKLTANLSSLVCLYFYYMVLSRSFLEMFKKKNTAPCVNSAETYPVIAEILLLVFCTKGSTSGFLLSLWNVFAQHCTTHRETGHGCVSVLWDMRLRRQVGQRSLMDESSKGAQITYGCV